MTLALLCAAVQRPALAASCRQNGSQLACCKTDETGYSSRPPSPYKTRSHCRALKHLPPEHVEVESCRADELAQRRGLTADRDERWSYVGKKAEPRWLWHAIAHASGTVVAYVFGRRQATVFLPRKEFLEPWGIR